MYVSDSNRMVMAVIRAHHLMHRFESIISKEVPWRRLIKSLTNKILLTSLDLNRGRLGNEFYLETPGGPKISLSPPLIRNMPMSSTKIFCFFVYCISSTTWSIKVFNSVLQSSRGNLFKRITRLKSEAIRSAISTKFLLLDCKNLQGI